MSREIKEIVDQIRKKLEELKTTQKKEDRTELRQEIMVLIGEMLKLAKECDEKIGAKVEELEKEVLNIVNRLKKEKDENEKKKLEQ